MLLYRARTDVGMTGNFLVAATLYQEPQDLLVPRGNLDLVQVDRGLLLAPLLLGLGVVTYPCIKAFVFFVLRSVLGRTAAD